MMTLGGILEFVDTPDEYILLGTNSLGIVATTFFSFARFSTPKRTYTCLKSPLSITR